MARIPELPTQEESAMAKAISAAVRHAGSHPAELKLAADDGPEVSVLVPAKAVRLLGDILQVMGRGKAVALLPVDAEVTTQQAADVLNVSRPHLVKLLEAHELPYRKVGRHRRVPLAELLDYKKRREEARGRALQELASLSEELGLYDDES